MAMTEHEGLQIYKDASGNSFILYPITKAHLVDGFEEAVMALAGIEDGLAKFAHAHAAGDISSGELAADRLPVVPVSKGGTGADNAADALNTLGVPAAVSELIASSGAAKMAVGTYAGTGKSGSSNPCSITLGFKPKLLIVDDVGLSADSKTGVSMIAYFSDLTNSYANKVAATRSVQSYTDSLGGLYFENENSYLFFKFDGTKLYWHYTRSSVGTDLPPLRQCNNSGHTFLFRAFG